MPRNRFDRAIERMDDRIRAEQKKTARSKAPQGGTTFDKRKPATQQRDPVRQGLIQNGMRMSGIERGLG